MALNSPSSCSTSQVLGFQTCGSMPGSKALSSFNNAESHQGQTQDLQGLIQAGNRQEQRCAHSASMASETQGDSSEQQSDTTIDSK